MDKELLEVMLDMKEFCPKDFVLGVEHQHIDLQGIIMIHPVLEYRIPEFLFNEPRPYFPTFSEKHDEWEAFWLKF